MAATTTATDAADKIAALKAAVQEKKVLPKRSTRGQNGSAVADESLISNASSQDYETTECYFLWGCELTRKNDSYVLPLPKTTDLSLEPEEHLLTIKSATLGVDAVEKERNVVEIRYHDREDKPTSSVLASLTLGQLDSCRLDLRLTAVSGRDVTLKLIKGSGPVSILGNHVVESVNSLVVDEEYQTEDSSADDDTDAASGMETDGDDVGADEVKDLKEDTKKAEEEAKAKEADTNGEKAKDEEKK